MPKDFETPDDPPGSLDLDCWAVAPVTFDVDAELDAWHDVQAVAAIKAHREESVRHRCPPDMPPCPECEERYARQDYIEFGDA